MNLTGYNMYIYKIWRIVFWRWQGGCPANTIKSCCQMSLGFEVGRIFLKNQSNLTDVETEGVHKLVNRLPSPTGSRWDSIDLFFYFINTTKSSKISLEYVMIQSLYLALFRILWIYPIHFTVSLYNSPLNPQIQRYRTHNILTYIRVYSCRYTLLYWKTYLIQ